MESKYIKYLKSGFLVLYLWILIPCNLLSHLFELTELAWVSKILLMPTLAGYFFVDVKYKNKPITKFVFLALLFSWLGDVFLIWHVEYPILFLIGLGAFLIAHINYVLVFMLDVEWNKKYGATVWITLLAMLTYTVWLVNTLWPSLGELKIPVVIYSIVLLFMGVASLIRKIEIGYFSVFIGAILFISSDSILAINKFHFPLIYGEFWVMITYTLAQLFIILGVIKVINSKV